MPSKAANPYILGSEAIKEKPRLNEGQAYFNILTDGELLPSHLAIKKDEPLQIADVATGTGQWLLDVYRQLPEFSSSRFMGFDVSSALFPPPDDLPAQIALHGHDIRRPFAADFIGAFDVVHVKFLKYAFRKTEWEVVLRNVIALLKPGGYLLWEDSDYSLYSSIPSSLAFTEMVNVDIEFALKCGRDIRHTETLFYLFESVGLTHRGQATLFSTDKPELKLLANDLTMRLFSTSLEGMIAQGGVKGCRTQQDVKTIIDRVQDDIDNHGLQIVHGIKRIWGQMPVSSIVQYD
ncbi:class I SAM-dependent methyltransferase [Aspergillus udagawae]|uniref:Methyltransferase domain-containing protein n=1 Tax=Aspergillus udagawae TaxID=91492 RepID=A0A8E0V530_9EURO|nr:uncharacterized protein Aud_001809 [Aspergillus udagawae]GIC94481.1 hypothetical protein Aud_001809 [Aspergillus udagawae]